MGRLGKGRKSLRRPSHHDLTGVESGQTNGISRLGQGQSRSTKDRVGKHEGPLAGPKSTAVQGKRNLAR